jgi:hypothetical protein
VKVLHIYVPARHDGITASIDTHRAVVLIIVVVDLYSLRMIDVDRVGILTRLRLHGGLLGPYELPAAVRRLSERARNARRPS